MRLRRWYTGGTIPPYRPDSDHIPAVLSPWIDTEIWDECHLHTDAELERFVTTMSARRGGKQALFDRLAQEALERGHVVDRAGPNGVQRMQRPVRSMRPSWWRRLLRWRP